jgi:hypothetical protein
MVLRALAWLLLLPLAGLVYLLGAAVIMRDLWRRWTRRRRGN